MTVRSTRRALMNSRLLNVNRWSNHPYFKNAVLALQKELKLSTRRYEACLTAIVAELYLAWRTDPQMYVAYTRNERKYGRGGRFHNRYFSYDVMVKAVDALWHRGYIENIIGTDRAIDPETDEVFGHISRMRIAKRLLRVLVRNRVKVYMIGLSPSDDVIVLRGKVKKETKKTKKGKRTVKIKKDLQVHNEPERIQISRKRLQAYNDLLSRTYIDVDDEHLLSWEKKKIRKYHLDLTRKKVYRIFNNGKWTEGGRYFRAWWMECPKILRKFIVINGDRTVELDYSGIHVQLLYALRGINYAERNEDPYALDGFPNRKLNKLVMLTAINAENDLKAVKGVWKQVRDAKMLREYGLRSYKQLYDILAALKAKHPLIEDKIASGYGVKLQYMDSQIAEEIVHYFTNRNIPILTVHDSFICSMLDEHVLLDVMKMAFTNAIRKVLDISYVTDIPEIHYAEGEILSEEVGDTIIAVDRKCLCNRRLKYLSIIQLSTYKQGRRYIIYSSTGKPSTVALVSNM